MTALAAPAETCCAAIMRNSPENPGCAWRTGGSPQLS